MSSPRDTEGQRFTSAAGRLLIATPLLLDPNFYRTVVYVVEHSEEGALGVVLNRPTEEAVIDHLPDWTDWLSDPPFGFVGGPVANEVAVGVVEKPGLLPESWDPTPDDVGLVDLSEGPDGLGSVASARVYSGYAGWVAGQLEMELRTGSWIVVEGGLADVFTTDPEALWRKVLKRQPDRRSLYASFPDDPASN